MNQNKRELIALGVSLAAHCQTCLTFYVDRARNLGIGEDEIDEAIAVERMIQKGAMSALDRLAESIVAGYEDKTSPCCDNAVGKLLPLTAGKSAIMNNDRLEWRARIMVE